MFSTRTRQLLRLGCALLLGTAVTALVPVASHAQTATKDTGDHCRTWDALRGKCPKNNPNTDDVLDYPQLYKGDTVTLEGRVEHIYSPTTFTMKDDYDLIQHGDQILMISVMPVGAKTTGAATTTTTDVNAPVPAVEMVQLEQNGFEHGKIIKATGLVQMFDRAALEQEYGHIDFGSIPVDKFENKPVLLLGTREYAQFHQQQQPVQEAVVIPPQQPETQPAPEPQPEQPPQVEQPAPQPQPQTAPPSTQPQYPTQAQPQPQETLPRTASPMPLIGLAGLAALMLGLAGIGIRTVRAKQ